MFHSTISVAGMAGEYRPPRRMTGLVMCALRRARSFSTGDRSGVGDGTAAVFVHQCGDGLRPVVRRSMHRFSGSGHLGVNNVPTRNDQSGKGSDDAVDAMLY